ncbi:ctnA [Symbiodinium sp. CCMP2592]|nr:ctnA [Symbiodinium sp. CCMP2592]
MEASLGVAAASGSLLGSGLSSSHEDMEDLISKLRDALRSPGDFQQFVQGLVPQGVPSDILKYIEAAVRDVLGGQAYLKLEGSAKKHTNIAGSDHDYHIRMPDPRLELVTRDQMEQIRGILNASSHLIGSSKLEADMGPTALKVRYQHGNICGSIDIVPFKSDYFDERVIVEPADQDFFNNIRRQNAARTLKFVAHKLEWGQKSYDLERYVVECDRLFPQTDPHGLQLFKKAMQKYEHLWPHDWPQELLRRAFAVLALAMLAGASPLLRPLSPTPAPISPTEHSAACSPCVQLGSQGINLLLNYLLNAGVVTSCSKLCSHLPTKAEQTICSIGCDLAGIKEFVNILNHTDLDPIYFCEAQTLGVGEFRLAVHGPVTSHISDGFLLPEGLTEGAIQLGAELKVMDDTSGDEPVIWRPGTYTFDIHLCQGECGSKHPHSKDFGMATGNFTLKDALVVV